MHYTIDEDVPPSHGLPHDPIKALVAPRPIGWISTLDENGVANLAPYSFFQIICDAPKIVMFSSASMKDSARNAQATGEFVCNIVGGQHAEAMNMTSVDAGPDEDEFELAGLDKEESLRVAPPRVRGAVAALECVVTQTIHPKTKSGSDAPSVLMFGQVVAVHIDDAFIRDGRFDSAGAGLVSRLGYMDYDRTDEVFEMLRP